MFNFLPSVFGSTCQLQSCLQFDFTDFTVISGWRPLFLCTQSLVCLFQSTSVILGLNRLNCCPSGGEAVSIRLWPASFRCLIICRLLLLIVLLPPSSSSSSKTKNHYYLLSMAFFTVTAALCQSPSMSLAHKAHTHTQDHLPSMIYLL